MIRIPGFQVSITQIISWVLIVVLIVAFILFMMNLRIVEKSTQIDTNEKSIQGIVNYLNSQVQPQPQRIPQPKKEVKEDGK